MPEKPQFAIARALREFVAREISLTGGLAALKAAGMAENAALHVLVMVNTGGWSIDDALKSLGY